MSKELITRQVATFGLRVLLRALLMALLMVTFAIPVSVARADDWPAFRGLTGDGRSNESGLIAAQGPVELHVKWKRDLGSGYSGIAVAGDMLVTQESTAGGESRESALSGDFLIALSTETGETLWRHRLGEVYLGHDGSHTGPLATPSLGSGVAVGLGARGELLAVDLDSGEIRWRRDLAKDFKARKPHYGFSTSPRIVDGQVLVAVGGYRRALLSLDPADGTERWAIGDDAVDYQSPMLWRRGLGDQPGPGGRESTASILLAGNSRLMNIDAEKGEVIWQIPHDGGGTRGSYSMIPVPAGPKGLLLAHLDDQSKFLELDGAGHPGATAWQSRALRNSYASAVFDKGHFYAYSSRFLTCVRAATGEVRWRSRKAGDGFPIWVDGHLVIQAKDGALKVAKATPLGYEERAELALFGDVSWNTPSFSNGAIYSRSFSEIARVDIRSAPGQEPPRESAPSAAASHGNGPLSPFWQRLHGRVLASDDPGQVIDEFLAAHPASPFIEDGQIHLHYRGPAQDVVIAGDLPGARLEWPLRRLGETDLFVLSLDLDPDSAFSYLFLVDYQRSLDPRNPRKAMNTVYGDDFEPAFGAELEMSFFAPEPTLLFEPALSAPGPSRGALSETALPRPGSSGSLQTFSMHSELLGRPVEASVYVPSSADSTKTLPTVFWLGGREALKWGQAEDVLDSVVGTRVQDLLVVFILDSGVGALGPLGDMVVQELIPQIERRFPASPHREHRALAGMGWDGLAAAHIGLAHGGTFGFLALQSVYALTAPEGGLTAWAGRASPPYAEIYLDWGRYDLRNSVEAWSTIDDNRHFFEALKARGFDITGGEVAAGAGWASWRRRTHRWLELFFPAEAP